MQEASDRQHCRVTNTCNPNTVKVEASSEVQDHPQLHSNSGGAQDRALSLKKTKVLPTFGQTSDIFINNTDIHLSQEAPQ